MITSDNILKMKAFHFLDLSIPIISGDEPIDSAIRKLGTNSSGYGLIIDKSGMLLGVIDPINVSQFHTKISEDQQIAQNYKNKTIQELITEWKTTKEDIKKSLYDDPISEVIDKLQGKDIKDINPIKNLLLRGKQQNPNPINLIPIIDYDGVLRGGAVTKESIKKALDDLLG